ncbi:MAG: helix-turn-helix transcriptional regulator [Bacteroidia bacterium]|nr:helix-turn-helix transcriptional regulator [Bacteroidia bacterium]
MKFQNIEFDKALSPFVKSITVFESTEADIKTKLPFFADGFPGLIFHETPNGLYVNPHKKRMPHLFVYGQTIEPIEIEIYGAYQMFVLQFFPFTLKSLFNIEPKSINDNCYDLSLESDEIQNHTLSKLSINKNLDSRITILTSYIGKLIDAKRNNFDNAIYSAIKKILSSKGKCSLTDIAKEVHLTKRTLERRFLSETGLLPKQFAKIIQFQNSLTQLSVKDFTSLTDVVFENGFADQSHFIRVFKSFTGKTPKQFITK